MPEAPAKFPAPTVDRPAIPAAYGAGKATEHVPWSRNPTRFRFAR